MAQSLYYTITSSGIVLHMWPNIISIVALIEPGSPFTTHQLNSNEKTVTQQCMVSVLMEHRNLDVQLGGTEQKYFWYCSLVLIQLVNHYVFEKMLFLNADNTKMTHTDWTMAFSIHVYLIIEFSNA